MFAEFHAGAVEAAADGAEGQVEHFGDGFVGMAVDFAEDQDCAKVVVESVEGCLDSSDSFAALERFVGLSVAAGRIVAGVLAVLIDGNGRFFAAPAAGGHVQSYPVEPCVKGAVALEGAQLEECLDKGILAHVATVFRRTGDVDQRVVQPVLVTGY